MMKMRARDFFLTATTAIGVTALLGLMPALAENSASEAKTEFVPKLHDANIGNITLFAQNPDIVTPVGIAVAPDGRVFVQENHTHKRNSNYSGPKNDRILVFEDTNADGVADKRSVFYEGHTFSTDLLFGPDGHLYVSTRWFIGRFRNASTQDRASGEPEKIVVCETDGDYPHNGVGGLAIDAANPNWLAFGFGENLGADYTFVGSDGVRISGGADGGSTYRCRTDGSELTRQSTGHWNAFGMTYDLKGNLFSTDNDPNATPPNRLLHVIPGADFGYEYRYGRSGRHPLVCWHGENPGTMGMIGALGEAACGVVSHGPGKLLSASWTDNRIDLHSLLKKGDTFEATREPFISGPDDFRPVHFSYSSDGRFLYFTDWVKISYPVHGHGRIWRVELKEPVSLDPLERNEGRPALSTEQAIRDLGSEDPAARTHAIHCLSQQPDALKQWDWQQNSNAIARAHYGVAVKRQGAKTNHGIVPALLEDPHPSVRFVGIKWVADERLRQFQPNVEKLLERSDLSRRDLTAVVATLARIDRESRQEFSPDETLLQIALDSQRPPKLRAMALRIVKLDYPGLTSEKLGSLADEKDPLIRHEAIRTLAILSDSRKGPMLSRFASDDGLDAEVRADAIAGLASLASGHQKVLEKLSQSETETIANEARRTLESAGIRSRDTNTKPAADDIAAWESLLGQAAGEPNLEVGRRLFFHSKLGGCYKCHAIEGRGQQVGPDLTTIGQQSGITPKWLLEHIVQPNAEMAPYYRPQQLLTYDGEVLTGLVIGKEGQKQAYVGTDGEIFFVDKDDVEERRELTNSIMPTGLLDPMTANEIRDLIAYLLQDRAP